MTDAVVNVLKPPGMTSHDVVGYVRKLYCEKRVGHMGTLDPGAAGVLPVALGKATRLIEFADGYDKSYRAQIQFGMRTDTGDDTGEVLATDNVAMPSLAEVEQTLSTFVGPQEQVVPMYSAVKINGKKLYEFAREGLAVEPIRRPITIHFLRLVSRTDTHLVIDVSCSKGSYIRTLCEDIGRRLGCLATMSLLIRTRVGPFLLEDAVSLEEMGANPRGSVRSPDDIVSHYGTMNLSIDDLIALKQGKRLSLAVFSGVVRPDILQRFRLYDAEDRFWGVVVANPDLQQIIPYKMMETPL